MAQHSDDTDAKLPALLKARSYEGRPDASALMLWGNRHGCEAHDR